MKKTNRLTKRCFDCGNLENLNEVKRLVREADEKGGGVTQTTMLCKRCQEAVKMNGVWSEVQDVDQ